jgi:predicted component of type VI protein secretion system
MSPSPERARVVLSVDPRAEERGAVPAETPPFCVLVLADLSGRDHGSVAPPTPLSARRPLPAPTLEELLARARTTLDFALDGPGRVRIEVRELEDLHPDRLIERLPHLRALMEAVEPAVAAHRASRGGSPARRSDPDAPGPPAAGRPAPDAPAPGGLLDEIVERTAPVERPLASGIPELEPWIRSVVAPHLVPGETEDQAALRRRLEEEVAEQVLRVLRAPPVLALEELLHSLLFLLASADPISGVRVHVLDVARSELESDLVSGALEDSELLRILLEPLPGRCGEAAPALVVGAYELGPTPDDVALLNRLAMIAHVLGAPWLCSAAPALWGAAADDDEAGAEGGAGSQPLWRAFRATPAARSVGLVAPPFLARLPYGPRTDPCDLAALDEGAAGRYVWGNPAFVCAAALAGSFARHGWGLGREGPADFDGRPVHVRADGEVGAHPTASVWTADRAQRVLAAGVMPLVTFLGQARMRLPWIGSMASPRAPLAGWWSGD